MNEEHISELKKLLTEWNPLGKYADRIPDLNDYETEACDILFFLNSKSSVQKIDKMITEVVSQAFNIDIDPQKSLECAQKVKLLLIKK
jgi:hypothetical protein